MSDLVKVVFSSSSFRTKYENILKLCLAFARKKSEFSIACHQDFNYMISVRIRVRIRRRLRVRVKGKDLGYSNGYGNGEGNCKRIRVKNLRLR